MRWMTKAEWKKWHYFNRSTVSVCGDFDILDDQQDIMLDPPNPFPDSAKCAECVRRAKK